MNANTPFDQYSSLFKGSSFSTAGMTDDPKVSRALVIGACRTQMLQTTLLFSTDFVLFAGRELPLLPRAIEEYDLVIVEIPLRVVIHDGDLLRLSYFSVHEWEHAFVTCKSRIDKIFSKFEDYLSSYQKTTFFLNYVSPSVNSVGRLQASNDLRNVGYFIRELNKYLEQIIKKYSTAYVIDIDNLAAMHGKRFFSEEFLVWYSHGGLGWPFSPDGQNGSRLEQTPHTVEHFEIFDSRILFESISKEISAALITIQNNLGVKLIVVDLDDTLWAGVAGEMIRDDLADPGLMDAIWGDLTEGWPLGIIEALQICRMRGILLAIISKNSEDFIRSIFPKIFGNKLTLDDFAVVRINWNSKYLNMQEILSVVNVLPENVLYIDDSPIERSEMARQYPTMRIIGKYFQYIRHFLISSPYTQVGSINFETANRIKSIRLRESVLAKTSSDSSIDSGLAEISICRHDISISTSEVAIDRIIELIHKTILVK